MPCFGSHFENGRHLENVKAIFLGVQRGCGLLYNPMENLKFRTLMLITSNWIMIDIHFDIVIGHH
jgi:hypothetical protein